MSCPPDDVLAAHLAGELDESSAIAEHLDGCDACRAIVVAAVRGRVGQGPVATAVTDLDAIAITVPDARAPTAVLPAGARVGRYTIDRLLGAGGMGAVYAAHDAELDRPVALKLLRAFGGPAAAAMAERLALESRLMARVRDPSVLTIFDAGRDGDRVYLAMELIDGGTLAAWLAARPRGWRAVLAVFRRAGTGLAAAHAAGLVHRDFKPENVLVDGDGLAPARVLVTDFGVARAVGGDDRGPPTPQALPDDPRLTATGVAVGTPAYRAPEQLAAGEVDARADVFGFAVALWEALWGARPFSGATVGELRAAIDRGPASPARGVPRWVERALRAALVADPDRRTPSMRALLAALDPAPRRRRAAIGLGAFAAVAIAGTTAMAMRGGATEVPDRDPCRAPAEALSALWTPAARARAIAAIRSGPDGDVADALGELLDGRVAGVRDGFAEVCGQDPATTPDHPARLACLDARRLEATALVEAFVAADPDAVAVADAAIAAIEDPALCRQEHPPRLRAMVPLDPALRRTVTQLRLRMIAIDQQRIAGHFEDASAAATALEAPIRATGFAPLVAEAEYLRGSLANVALDSGHAAALLLDAARTAERAGHDYIAAASWIQLAQAEALDERDAGRAREYLANAQAALDRLGGDRTLAVELDQARAIELLLERRFEDARALLAAAIPRAAQDAPDEVSALVVSLGSAFEDAGRFRDAEATYLEALASTPQAQGSQLTITTIRARLASVYMTRGLVGLAVIQAGLARASAVALYAPDHTDRLEDELLWGDALLLVGDARGAIRLGTQVAASAELVFDDRNPMVAEALALGADGLAQRGDLAGAERERRRSCDILGFRSGTDSVDAAECRVELLSIRDRDAAAARAALPGLDADLEIIEDSLGAEHLNSALARGLRARLLLALGRLDEAAATLTAALAAIDPAEIDPGAIAELELTMAQVARARGAPVAEVRQWARQAVARFGVAPPKWARRAAAARALLR
ncbi:MAG: serine/threonine protein kinase [Deltaproteobacteria bacterium]|nr:serine/threonine protein kinase [Deltaproteobacteria bacterium]